jgi:hypothetical protein
MKWNLVAVSGRISRLVAVTAIVGMGLSGVAVEPAFSDDNDAVSVALTVAPAAFAAGGRVAPNGTGAVASVGGTDAQFPVNAGGVINVTNAIGDVSRSYEVGLPAGRRRGQVVTSRNVVSYDNGDGTSTVSTVKADGSLAIGTTIGSASAPTEFAFPISNSGVGARLRIAADGSVDVSDRQGRILTHFLTPWAKDADGVDVPTHYEVKGNVLTQVVAHAGFTYPVVADPTSSQYFQKVVIDTKADARGAIVRVYPGNLPAHGTGDALYADYKTLVAAQYEGQKFRDQLVCHWANVGSAKSPWNLDSWRPNVGYAATVAALCNPN